MSYMEFNLTTVTYFLSIFCLGTMAGTFFIWTNTIKPGLGKLDDRNYLSSFKSMNKVILNPWFYFFFWGAILFPIIVILNFFSEDTMLEFWILLSAGIIYWLGVFFLTVFGNIPLNNLLEKSSLQNLNEEELKELRTKIEVRWNTYNLMRTVTSFIAFGLIILSLML